MAIAAAGLRAGGAGCSDDSGEIALVVATDLSIPKDIDRIQITVQVEGKLFLDIDYPSGSEDLRLPGTLGILGDPGQAISIRASALQDDAVVIAREVNTEIPDVLNAMLRVPLNWLCDSSAGGPSACPSGLTCIAGQCAPSGVDSSTLPPFSNAEVFGGGSGAGLDGKCFDTRVCFDDAVEAAPESGDLGCTVPLPPGATSVNVALKTEASGICGPKGCFVALNQEDGEGFGVAGSRIKLPPAVCDRFPGKLLGVAVSTRCEPKLSRTPACGPWSLAGKAAPPDPSIPVTLADGQRHPSAVVVGGESVHWVNAGIEGAEDGEVKKAPVAGGSPVVLVSHQAYPSALAIDRGVELPFLYWVNEGTGAIAKARADRASSPTRLITWPGARSGLSVYGSDLYFSSAGGLVLRISAEDGGAAQLVADPKGDPLRVAADSTGVYWTDRANGEVLQRPAEGGPPEPLASDQKSPTALLVDAPSVYWLNAGTAEAAYEDGAVMRVSQDGGDAVALAQDQKLPYAIASDAETIYWTNKGDGTVMRVSKSGAGLAVLASGQRNPVAIAVDGTSVYWANAGTAKNGFGDGSIMKVAK